MYSHDRKTHHRKASVTWFGDSNHQLGTKWLYKKKRPEIFGFAKGIVLGLKYQWKEPFVIVRYWDGADEMDYVVKSENQLRPILI